jgi:hypothetical protein
MEKIKWFKTDSETDRLITYYEIGILGTASQISNELSKLIIEASKIKPVK